MSSSPLSPSLPSSLPSSSIEKEKIICTICNKEFSSKSSLSTHKKTAKFCKKIAESQSTASESNENKNKNSNSNSYNVSFISDMKNYYEQIINARDERIDLLENLIEKMEAKIERYQNTIMGLALRTITNVNTRNNRCSDPSCDGCRAEDREEERLKLIIHLANLANTNVNITSSSYTTNTGNDEDDEDVSNDEDENTDEEDDEDNQEEENNE